MENEQYIGPFKVLGITKDENLKTPSGGEIVRVMFESGPTQIMTTKAFEALVTKEATDLTSLGDRKVNIVRDAIIEALCEYDPTALEIQTILQRVSNKVSNVYDRASHFLFTKEVYGKGNDDSWVPGANFSHYRTLNECNAVLLQIGKDDATAQNTTDK